MYSRNKREYSYDFFLQNILNLHLYEYQKIFLNEFSIIDYHTSFFYLPPRGNYFGLRSTSIYFDDYLTKNDIYDEIKSINITEIPFYYYFKFKNMYWCRLYNDKYYLTNNYHAIKYSKFQKINLKDIPKIKTNLNDFDYLYKNSYSNNRYNTKYY